MSEIPKSLGKTRAIDIVEILLSAFIGLMLEAILTKTYDERVFIWNTIKRRISEIKDVISLFQFLLFLKVIPTESPTMLKKYRIRILIRYYLDSLSDSS
jgi:hypothetical protein